MNWLSILVRSVGAAFPVASSLVQLQAELDSVELQKRLRKLEDPISNLHPDVPDLSQRIYRLLSASGNKIVTDDIYPTFSRALHILEAQGAFNVPRTFGRDYPETIWVTDPTYVLYMAALYEDPLRMDAAVSRIDQAVPKTWLRGSEIAGECEIPLAVAKAIFQLYEARGLGLLSKERGTVTYYVKA